MNSLIDLFLDLRARHPSASSALGALTGPRTGPVRELLELLRDEPLSLFRAEASGRGFRLPVTASARALRERVGVLGRKLLRRERVVVDGFCPYPHRRYDMESVRRMVERTAELWSVPSALQGVLSGSYSTATIVGVNYPWFGDARYGTLLGDGCVLATFRVLEFGEGGPRRVRLVRRDDAEFHADLATNGSVPERIRDERTDVVGMGGPDFTRYPGECARLRSLGLDGNLDVSRLPEVYRVLVSRYARV